MLALQVLALSIAPPQLTALVAAANWGQVAIATLNHLRGVSAGAVLISSTGSSSASTAEAWLHAWLPSQQLLLLALTHALLPALLLRLRCAAAGRQAAGGASGTTVCSAGISNSLTKPPCTASPPARLGGRALPAARSSRDPAPCPPHLQASICAAAVAEAADPARAACAEALPASGRALTLPAGISTTSSTAPARPTPSRVMDLHKLLAAAAAARRSGSTGSACKPSYRPITCSKVVGIKVGGWMEALLVAAISEC